MAKLMYMDNALIGGVPETKLNALTDTLFTSLANGDMLKYNGTKWVNDAQVYLPFNNKYIDDCNHMCINGYAKTCLSTTGCIRYNPKNNWADMGKGDTANLPSACTDKAKWGIIFNILENQENGTGTQMYFPIDGTVKGHVFIRSIVDAKIKTTPVVSTWTDLNNYISGVTSSQFTVTNGVLSLATAIQTEIAKISTAIQEPTEEGTEGQVLTTDGAGGRSWTTVSGGGISDWSELDNKPTSIEGYGITDAYTKDEINNLLSNNSGGDGSGTSETPGIATSEKAGIVKINNNNFTIDEDGTISLKLDTSLSSTSTNAVQNKTLYSSIAAKLNLSDFRKNFYGLENILMTEQDSLKETVLENYFNTKAYLTKDGSITSYSGRYISNFIGINENIVALKFINISGTALSVCFYDEDNNFLDGTNYSNQLNFIVLVPSSAKFFRYSISSTDFKSANSDIIELSLKETNKQITNELSAVMKGTDAWSSSKSYAVGDCCIKDSTIYACIKANSNTTPPNSTYWEETSLSKLKSNLANLIKIESMTVKTNDEGRYTLDYGWNTRKIFCAIPVYSAFSCYINVGYNNTVNKYFLKVLDVDGNPKKETDITLSIIYVVS